jgi:hypothetical protein
MSIPPGSLDLSKAAQVGKSGKTARAQRKRTTKYNKLTVDSKGFLIQPESSLQKLCESYLVLRKLEYIHIPDVIGRLCRVNDTRITIHEKKQLSFNFKGKSDLLIFHPCGKYTATLVIELKAGKNKTDADQREFLKYCLGDDDWKGAVVKDFDTFKERVDEFVKHCNKQY